MYIINVRDLVDVVFDTFKYTDFNDFCSKYMELLQTGYTMYFKCDDYKNNLSISYFERRDYGKQTTED